MSKMTSHDPEVTITICPGELAWHRAAAAFEAIDRSADFTEVSAIARANHFECLRQAQLAQHATGNGGGTNFADIRKALMRGGPLTKAQEGIAMMQGDAIERALAIGYKRATHAERMRFNLEDPDGETLMLYRWRPTRAAKAWGIDRMAFTVSTVEYNGRS